MTNKVLLTLDSGSLRGIIQLEIINILDTILQKKKLEKVLGYNHTGESLSTCQASEVAPSSTETLHAANPPIGNIDEVLNSLKDSSTGSIIESALKAFCNDNKLSRDNIRSALETRFMDYVDYVAGVSIGSIIAAGLTICDEKGKYKYTTQDLMTALAPEGFLKKTPWYNIQNKFDDKFLELALEDAFKMNDGTQATFDNLTKAKLMTTSYNIDNNKQTIFTNFSIIEDTTPNLSQNYVDVLGSKTTLVDASMASAALQVAFPARQMSYTLMNDEKITDNYHIDGGNIRGTPLLEAISTLIIDNKQALKDLVVVSIGTGTTDFDMSDLKNGSIWSYVKNILGFGKDSFINCNILCQANSIKDTVSDLIDNTNRNEKIKNFYDLNVSLDKTLYNASLDLTSLPKYQEATQKAFVKDSAEYKELEVLADYLLSTESLMPA